MAGPLQDVRVVDLCDEKGAYCGKLLADLGADVVLVEPAGGSPMRRIGPLHPKCPPNDPRASLFFWHYNSAKRTVVMDLDSPRSRHDLVDLVRTSDILIDSFPPGTLAARGLDDTRLAAGNPGLIHVSITPFGRSGPYRDYRISDLIAQSMGGLAYVNGESDGSPLQGLGLQAYHSAGVCGAIAAMLALLSRQRGGGGRSIDVSIHAAAAAVLEHATSLFRQDGTIARRNGGMHWTRAFRIGPCGEGFVNHSTFGDWTTLAEWVVDESPDSVLADPRWGRREHRVEHAEQLFDALDAWARTHPADELAESAQLRRLPYAALGSLAALPSHPQLAARNYFVRRLHEPTSSSILHAGPPFVLSDRFAGGECSPPTATAAAGATRTAPLAGVRVIDFTWAVAGPLATRILADYGAEVIKVERPDLRTDPARARLLAAGLNRGKQSIAIDMTTPQGVDLAGELIARSDVVVDNFSPRVMSNWGLDDDHLRRLRPDLIAIGMSGFGATGPYRERVSYGPTLQAAAGHSSMMRDARGQPVGWGFSYADMIAGRTAALAVLVALWQRHRSGHGQRIDFSQFESLIAVSGPLVLAAQTSLGAAPPGNGSQEADASPHGVYRCADRPEDAPARDRWCAIAVFGDDDWRRFCSAVGSPAWTAAKTFATHAARQHHREALDAEVTEWTSKRSPEEVMDLLQHHGIAAGVVANAKDLCVRDVQLRQRGYWVATRMAAHQTTAVDGSPFDGFGESHAVSRPSPAVGQDTDAVLADVLQLPGERVRALRRDGVVA